MNGGMGRLTWVMSWFATWFMPCSWGHWKGSAAMALTFSSRNSRRRPTWMPRDMAARSPVARGAGGTSETSCINCPASVSSISSW